MLTGALGSATDPFGGLPSINTAAPKGADFNDGDHGVDEERGAATYSYPIAVPPGRSGMQPSLALSYSSQAPLRGGIAVGWKLFNFPMVEVDRSRDTNALHYAVNGARLVEVDDIKGSALAVYRAAYDASFTRWERRHDVDSGDYWIARSLDGSHMEFKRNVGDRQWRLTSQVDTYGNRIDYDWGDKVSLWDHAPAGTPRYVAYELKQILYTANGTQLAPHAKVTFTYSDTQRQDGSWIPPGSQLTWTDGPSLTNTGDATGVVMGARQLNNITTWVKDPSAPTGWRDVQTTTLSYEFSDPAHGAQLRYLKNIFKSAKAPCPYGTTCAPQVTVAPPVTFSYGTYDRRWDAERHVDIAQNESVPIDSGRSGSAAGATTGFLDVNGDGLRDFVRIAPIRNKEDTKTICTLIWRQGLGDGHFGAESPTQQISIPTTDWLNKSTTNSPSLGFDSGSFEAIQERCTLTGQYALEYQHYDFGQTECHNDYLKIIGYHFGDYDNNGELDILTTPWRAFALDDANRPTPFSLNPPTPHSRGDGTCTASPCPGEGYHCAGGTCWQDDIIPHDIDGWNTGDDGTGGGGGGDNPGGGHIPPSRFDPETCAEWAALEPVHTNSGIDDFCEWGLLAYNPNNHAFEATNTIMSQLPLPPSGEEGLVQASRGFSPLTLQTLVDIDGDGFLDIVATPRDPQSHAVEEWRTERLDLGLAKFVRVGYGEGGRWFTPATFNKGQGGLLASSSGLFPNWAEQPTSADITANATLDDMNGDGLPDLVVHASGPLTYYPNTGKRFAANAINLGHHVPTSKTHVDVTSWSDNFHPDGGTRQSVNLLFDVDEDGRPDMVEIQDTAEGKAVRVRYNLADGFSAMYTLPREWLAIAQTVVMEHGEWKTIGRVTDVDGDGLLDLQGWTYFTQVPPEGGANLVDPTVSRRMSWYTDNYGISPPRLLRRIDNGHGAQIEYEYKASSKLQGAGSPKSPFVVTKVTTTPGSASVSPPMSTEYSYARPKYGGHITISPYEIRALQFQGFQEVEIKGSAPKDQGHGTDVVKTYEYKSDGRGYLTQSRSYIWDNGAVSRRLLSVDSHTWVYEGLFNDRVSFIRGGLAESRVCLTSDEAACLGGVAQDRFSFSSSFTTYKPYLINGQKAFLISDTSSQATSDDPGEQRLTHTSFDVLYAVDGESFNYRVLPKETKTEHQAGLGPSATVTTTGREVTSYDADHFPVRTQTWYGPGANEYVASERTFDRATGLVLTTKRPEQVRQGANGRVATYTYDANKVFAEVEINELGYGAHSYHDPGTGAVIRKTGPNMAWVFNSSTCTDVLCPRSLQTEESTWAIDGFGRVLASATTYQLSDTVTAAPMVTLATATYDDINNTVTSRSLIDPRETSQRWMTTRTQMDGLGRTLLTRTCRTAGVDGSDSSCLASSSNAVVTFAYDGAGLMISTTMPSPASDAASVTYRFDHDALGREVLMARADGSAMRTDYGPLYKRVLETGTIASGGSTVAYSDMDGNIVRVLECLEAPCESLPGDGLADSHWSATKYTYDDAARLVSVLDAEWRETEMDHDLLGRRTTITRGTRVWKYTYDHDGNLTNETSPLPVGESDVAKYTSFNSYDALDRITLHVPASRGASDLERASSWVVPFVYTYDDGPNAVGRLSSVKQSAFTPLGASHVYYFDVDYAYDGMGRVKLESRLMNPTGAMNHGITQTLANTYNALGAVTQSVWDDGQTISAVYDDRGLTKKISFAGGGNIGNNVIADYGVRNRAGLPLLRATSQTFAKLSRAWTYDSSGRVLTDVIQRPANLVGAPLVEAQRTYAYLPSGELRSVLGMTRVAGADTGTGFQNINETFEYDAAHRLKHAHETATNYDLSLRYDRTGNIMTAKATGLPLGTGPNQNRDVTYHYDWLDPQAVDQLIDNRTGNSLAMMSYTPMGEMSTRQWPLGSEQRMDWDGDGQLREVHTPDGTIERYAYDHTGQRIWVVKDNAVDAGTRYFFGASETLVPASGSSGKTRYIYVADGGGTLARTERVDERVTTIELSFADTLQNVFLTAKGSTRADGSEIPNPVAFVTSWFNYGAFGEVIAQAGQDTHRRQFNGKEADAATGLRYYGARYYDPLLIRWTSADPLYRFAPDMSRVEPQRQNLYAFSLNNPVRYLDPDGRDGTDNSTIEKRCGGDASHCSQARKNSPTADEVAGADGETFGSNTNAYREMKAHPEKYKPVKPNPALDMTGSIVDATPRHSGTLWLLFTALMGGPPKGPLGLPEPPGGGAQVAPSAQPAAAPVRYGPMNQGPLAPEVANTFRSGTYTATKLSEATTLYRVYGGRAAQLGKYWTRVSPAGPVQAIIDLALKPIWGNSAVNVVKIQVPAGTTIFEGYTAAQGALVGGGQQVVVPRVDPTWVVK